MEQLVFYVFAGVVLLSALMVVAMRNPVRSIFLFFVTLFSMAGLFVFALADFIAITQVVIYVGGVLVLMIFTFLLSSREILNIPLAGKRGIIGIHQLPGIAVALIFFAVLAVMVYQTNPDQIEWVKQARENTLQPTDNTIHYIGINMMTRYLVPFEVVSVLLMVALVGAAHLARKERKI